MGENEYNIGRDMQKFEDELLRMQTLLQELFEIIKFNMDKEVLEEPKKVKK